MLLLPACVIKAFKVGKPSTSFCGAQVVNLMFAAAMDSKLMFSAISPHNTCSSVPPALEQKRKDHAFRRQFKEKSSAAYRAAQAHWHYSDILSVHAQQHLQQFAMQAFNNPNDPMCMAETVVAAGQNTTRVQDMRCCWALPDRMIYRLASLH